MILWIGAALAAPEACDVSDLSPPDAHVQAAWISPVRRRIRPNQPVEVVLVDDLRGFIDDDKADQTRVLQALGFVGRRAGWRANRLYKVTVFEVAGEELCRPIQGLEPGAVITGARVCERSRSCGTSTDTLTGEPGLAVYEVPWRDAARWGFCVAPLELYVNEL
ncbi:MAG: hypothetical protein GY913_03590 [Proteobacteria bacterium]|nr:hypothetical protein [Pseudomonadota bacterium]MCP4915984.1 hypothetical protein [Pseudomonadota bacterium]